MPRWCLCPTNYGSDINNDTTYSLAVIKSNKGIILEVFAAILSNQHELYFDVINFTVALFRILSKNRPEPLELGTP